MTQQLNHHDSRANSSTAPQHGARTSWGSTFGFPFIAGCTCAGAVGVFMSSQASLVTHAYAGPPSQSALSIQQNQESQKMLDAMDSGKQRLELVNELKLLRQEVAGIRALVTSGVMATRIANFDEMKFEIDYAKLAQAVKTAMKSE